MFNNVSVITKTENNSKQNADCITTYVENLYHCLSISKHAMLLLKTSCSCTPVIAVMVAGSLSIQFVLEHSLCSVFISVAFKFTSSEVVTEVTFLT